MAIYGGTCCIGGQLARRANLLRQGLGAKICLCRQRHRAGGTGRGGAVGRGAPAWGL